MIHLIHHQPRKPSLIVVVRKHVNVHSARYAAEHATAVGCVIDLASWVVHSGPLEGSAKVFMLVGCAAIYLAHAEEREARRRRNHASLWASFTHWLRE